MNKTLAIAFAALLGLSLTDARADWVEDRVTEIRAKYNQIQGWQMQSQTIQYEDAVFAKMTRFTYNGQTVKIVLEHGGDHGGAYEEYFYDNGQLFFVYKSDSGWNFTGKQLPNGESETVDSMTEYRIYFHDNQLIRLLKKSVQSTNADALKGMLAKTQNEPYQDPALASQVQSYGVRLPGIWDSNGLEGLVMGQ